MKIISTFIVLCVCLIHCHSQDTIQSNEQLCDSVFYFINSLLPKWSWLSCAGVSSRLDPPYDVPPPLPVQRHPGAIVHSRLHLTCASHGGSAPWPCAFDFPLHDKKFNGVIPMPTDIKCDFYEDINDVTQAYRSSLYQFTAQVYKTVATKARNQFVFSPLSAWIILAAIAEGADPDTKLAMFQFLRLPPYNPCTRLKYYQLATSRFHSGDDVYITNKRALVIDEGVIINPVYYKFVLQNSLLNVVSTPLRYDPQSALKELQRITSATLENIDLSGNSVIIDITDYNGLWTTSFEDAVVEKSPFYSQTGVRIGSVDLMRVKRRARMAYVQSINAKALELPVGQNGRYRLIFALVLDSNTARAVKGIQSTIIDEFLSSLKESYVPIDIAIPRVNITTEYDVKSILEDFGVKDLWTKPAVTAHISDPAALPSGFVQRATLSLDTAGLKPAPEAYQSSPSFNAPTGLDPIIGNDFIVDSPFLFALFDAETYTCIMAAVVSQPTYTD